MTQHLTHQQLHAVRRALKAGARHTEIARDLDLAVSTIARIATDRKLRRRKLALLSEADLPEDDPPPDYAASRLRRCPGCGGMVYRWPCLACRLTAISDFGFQISDLEPKPDMPSHSI